MCVCVGEWLIVSLVVSKNLPAIEGLLEVHNRARNTHSLHNEVAHVHVQFCILVCACVWRWVHCEKYLFIVNIPTFNMHSY